MNYVISLLLIFTSSLAVGAPSYLFGDGIKSTDRTKTWLLPPVSDTIVGEDSLTGANITFNSSGLTYITDNDVQGALAELDVALAGFAGTLGAIASDLSDLDDDFDAHVIDTTSVHGITDTADLATDTELNAHASDTTSVHGITDTSNLLDTTNSKTVTNKSIDGSSNTLTNVSLTTAVTGTLPIANGGTGQTSAANAINALVPSQGSNSGKYLKTDGSVVSWDTPSGGGGGGSLAYDVESKTTTFTAAVSTTAITKLYLISSAGGAFTASFPAAAGNTGASIAFKKTTSDLNKVTLGATTHDLYTQNEMWIFTSDGSTWNWVKHDTQSPEIDGGPVIVTASGGGYGATETTNKFVWERRGDKCIWRWDLITGGGVGGAGDYSFAPPTGLGFDLTNATGSGATVYGGGYPAGPFAVVGNGYLNYGPGAVVGELTAFIQDGTNFKVVSPGYGVWHAGGLPLYATNIASIKGEHRVPGWEP